MGQCLCFKWAVITSGHFLCRTTCRDCGETLTSFCIWLQFEDTLTLLPCQTCYSTTHLNLPLLLVGNLSVTSSTRHPWITELQRHMSDIIFLCMFPITSVTVLSILRLPATCCSLFIFSPSSVVIMQPSWLHFSPSCRHALPSSCMQAWNGLVMRNQFVPITVWKSYDTRQRAFKCCVIFVENVRSLWSTEGNLHQCLA